MHGRYLLLQHSADKDSGLICLQYAQTIADLRHRVPPSLLHICSCSLLSQLKEALMPEGLGDVQHHEEDHDLHQKSKHPPQDSSPPHSSCPKCMELE